MSNNQLAERRNSLNRLLTGDGFKKQLALALPRHLTPDRVLRIALTAANKTPKLFECDPNTILASVMDCSQLGLEPDGRKAHLIPFNDSKKGMICQLIIGYQGYIDLAYRHPLVRGIRAKAVFEKDHFIYDEGLHPRLEHTPSAEDDPGPLVYAYAICDIGENGHTFVVLSRREVMKAKKSSRGSDSVYSPWRTHEAEMWVKTAIRRLAKFMPSSTELTEALQIEDDHEMKLATVTGITTANVGASTTEPTHTLPSEPEHQQEPEQQQEKPKQTTRRKPDPKPHPSQEQAPWAEPEPHEEPAAEEGQTEPVEQAPAPTTTEPPKPAGRQPSADSLRKNILQRAGELNVGRVRVQAVCKQLGWIDDTDELDKLPAAKLAEILDGWDEVVEAIRNPA